MSRKDALERLRKQLLAQRADLQRKVADDMGLAFQADDGINDIGETALQVEQAELHTQLAALESRELDQIHHALEHIKLGTYGDCNRCGKSIPVARLQALPFSTMCVDCQRKTELRGEDDDLSVEENWRQAYDHERRSSLTELSLQDIPLDLD